VIALRQWKSISPDNHSLYIVTDLYHSSNQKGKKESRINLHKALQPTKMTVKLLLQDWLTTSQKGNGPCCRFTISHTDEYYAEEPEFKMLREAYLPEIILAYDSILHFSGIVLSRDNFLECMELSTIIAAEDSDLAEMFVKKGRMKELVEAFADNSRALLQANTSGKSRTGTTSKKLRNLGWTRELWDIKL
jgi:nuclear pore complex protein Nup107